MKLSISVDYSKYGEYGPKTLTDPEEWPDYELDHVWIGDVDVLSELSEAAKQAILEQLE